MFESELRIKLPPPKLRPRHPPCLLASLRMQRSPVPFPQSMAKVVVQDRVYMHEAKQQPTDNPPGKIVEAFGLGKCPKLAAQVHFMSHPVFLFRKCTAAS